MLPVFTFCPLCPRLLPLVPCSDDMELARVAPPEYEVELEYCGQKLFREGTAGRLAQSMYQKVQDLVKRVMSGARTTASGAHPSTR